MLKFLSLDSEYTFYWLGSSMSSFVFTVPTSLPEDYGQPHKKTQVPWELNVTYLGKFSFTIPIWSKPVDCVGGVGEQNDVDHHTAFSVSYVFVDCTNLPCERNDKTQRPG